VPNWKALVQDRRKWKELVEKAKTLHKKLCNHTNKKKTTLYTTLLSPIRATCLTHLILLDLITRTIFDEQYSPVCK